MSRADDAADALEAIVNPGMGPRPSPADRSRREILRDVLAEALDGPELTRLWLVARHRLGSPVPVGRRIDAGHCVVCDQIIGLRPARPLPGGGLIHVACAGEAGE